MDERLILISWFGLGTLIQAILLIRNDLKWGQLAICLGTGLFGMMPGKHEHHYDPLLHMFFCFCVFAVVFALKFKDDILPLITEKVLLSYSLVFWYSFFAFFYKDALIHKFLFVLFLIPSLATVAIAFIKVRLNFWGKLLLYIWFLVIVISLGLFRFSFYHLSLFFDHHHTPWVGSIDCILTGMAFLYIFVNATYIWELIPIQGKNQTREQRMKEWHELTDLMTHRCNDLQPSHLQTVLILVLQGGGLYLNYIYHLVPAGFVINVLLLLPIFFTSNGTAKDALKVSRAALLSESTN